DSYLCPLEAVDCVGETCPLGNYACIPNSEGVLQCSPHPCSAFNPDSFEDEDTTEGENDKKDDGPVDEDGGCLGTLYIFSGNDKRCRMSGISTQFKNCCKDQYSSFLLSMDICNGKEVQLTQLKEKGLCHYVGQYCSKRLPLIGCVQNKKTYCCFHSKLGRIINEQGRSQLQNFGSDGGWGAPKNPNCRGFTTDEFQMLNFSLIDLSEWYSDITTKSVQEVQDSMQQKMDRFYE
ncbi:MAG: conjugal transfer protein TraN, partial [Desulfosarcina sp.]|nr:conjugal transfer protein TraN [Desulfobacterales bacterium]